MIKSIEIVTSKSVAGWVGLGWVEWSVGWVVLGWKKIRVEWVGLGWVEILVGWVGLGSVDPRQPTSFFASL